MDGFIKLERSLVDAAFYKDINCKVLFIHLRLMAAYNSYIFGPYELQAGQCVSSIRRLSAETGLSVKEVRNAIDRLIEYGEIEIRERKKASLNGNALQSPGKLAGNFCAIIFSPQDIELVKEGPSVRRKFLDTAIFQIYPQYADFLRKYVRAVAQRNNLLKDVYYHSELISMLDAFDNEIIKNGEKIIEYRKKYISHLI